MNQPPVDLITDPKAIVAALDALWAGDNQLQDLIGRPARPLRDILLRTQSSTENPYWDIVSAMPSPERDIWENELCVESYGRFASGEYAHLPATRDTLVSSYAWAIPSPTDLALIDVHLDGRGVVEIGAGTGYWAWQLSQLGIDVAAYDIAPRGNRQCHNINYHPVAEGGPEKAAEHPDRALMLCWPPYAKAMAHEALTAFTGDMLIYIGEGHGGCTADDAFHEALEADWEAVAGSGADHINFFGIHSRLIIYRRVNAAPADEPEPDEQAEPGEPPRADLSFFALPKPPPAKWFRHKGLDDRGYREHVAQMIPGLNLIYLCIRPDATEFDKKAGGVAFEAFCQDQVSAWVVTGWLANMAAVKLPALDEDHMWTLTTDRVPRSFRDELGAALDRVTEAATFILDDVIRHRVHQPIKDWGIAGVLAMIAMLCDVYTYANGWTKPDAPAPLISTPRMGRNP